MSGVSDLGVFIVAGLLFLGLLFTVNGTLVNILVALLAASCSKKVEVTATARRVLKSIAGTVFMAFGIRLALVS